TALERKPAAGPAFLDALRALAWITLVGALREQISGQELVEHLSDFGGLALHHFVTYGLEVAPECLEHRLPLRASAGDVVELLLHPGGEIVGHVAGEEAFQKRRQKTPGVLCEETVFLHPHIGAIAQYLDRRSVGRWPPDAQFLQTLYEARL